MGILQRYIKLWVARALEMSGTFSRPWWVSDLDMHHGTCMKNVPWCMRGSLTSSCLWNLWQGKLCPHSSACTTDKFTYLVRGPCKRMRTWWWYSVFMLIFTTEYQLYAKTIEEVDVTAPVFHVCITSHINLHYSIMMSQNQVRKDGPRLYSSCN